MQIEKRLRAEQNNLVYNQGACPKYNYTNLIQNPELDYSTFVKFAVPLLYRVKEDGTVYDIALEDNFINYDSRQKVIEHPDFLREAIRVLKLGKWRPFAYEGVYVNREGSVVVNFFYHPEYFKLNAKFALNPEIKAKFNGDPDLFKRYTNPNNGANGTVVFLVIVEINGTISNEICLFVDGQTNREIGLFYLKELTTWKPAIKNGEKVRSQVMISIYT